MASYKYVPFGVEVMLEDYEVKIVKGALGMGGAGVVIIATVLGVLGNISYSGTLSTIVAAICTLSTSSLDACNHHGKGIVLTIIWRGPIWCRSQ